MIPLLLSALFALAAPCPHRDAADRVLHPGGCPEERERGPAESDLFRLEIEVLEVGREGIIVAKGVAGEPVTSPTLGVFVHVPEGKWWMGSPPSAEPERDVDEGQALTQVGRRLVAKTELTRGHWKAVGTKLGRSLGEPWGVQGCRDASGKALAGPAAEACPVTSVTWCQAVWFANLASEADGLAPAYALPAGFQAAMADEASCDGAVARVVVNLDATGYRLLTEAEWEWAARGGETSRYAGSERPEDVAWFGEDTDSPHASCGKAANGWGLCDLSGNVWEWVADADAFKLPGGPSPLVGGSGPRVVRGGDWSTPPEVVRVATRERLSPGIDSINLGFRLTRSVP